MPLDLQPLNRELDQKPYGLILLSARAGDEVRRAVWETLGTCETLYWVGPLADKPVVRGGARCWLAECTLEERPDRLRHVLRLDGHAVHAIGPADGVVFELLVRGALSGLVTVAELEADDLDGLQAKAATLGVPEDLVKAAGRAAVDVNGQLRLLSR